MILSDISVELLEHMGSDLDVVNDARVSFDKIHYIFDDEDDTGLIEYLAKNDHWSPFAHSKIKFRVKAPLFVARQLHKHHVGFDVNEVSRKYVDSEPEFYMPEFRSRAKHVKQGSSSVVVDNDDMPSRYIESIEQSVAMYNEMLANNVAPEVARAILPQCMMTTWIWTSSLYGWARMVRQRTSPFAQKESSEVAWKIYKHMIELFPVSTAALMKSRNV